MAIILSAIMEKGQAGNGINGVLIAAPIADGVAAVVILVLTVMFFRALKEKEYQMK